MWKRNDDEITLRFRYCMCVRCMVCYSMSSLERVTEKSEGISRLASSTMNNQIWYLLQAMILVSSSLVQLTLQFQNGILKRVHLVSIFLCLHTQRNWATYSHSYTDFLMPFLQDEDIGRLANFTVSSQVTKKIHPYIHQLFLFSSFSWW